MAEKIRKLPDWFTLDNAAKIYPASASKRWNMVFRVSAILKDGVDPIALQSAVEDTLKRFPTYQCTLKKGIFWFYLEKLPFTPLISADNNGVCKPMELYTDKHLFRVITYKNKIALEVFHSLSDGSGAITVLNTLLKRYFELKGIQTEETFNALNVEDAPKESEVEDSFVKYADLKKCEKRGGKSAYKIKGTPLADGKNRVTTLVMSEKALKAVAADYNCSITQLTTAVIMQSIFDERDACHSKKPVIAEIPINLRKRFPSETVRNFATFTQISAKSNGNLQELIKLIQDGLIKGTDKNRLMENINANVRDEKNLALRLVPRFLKNFGMSIAAALYSDRIETFPYSALGRLDTPKEFNALIDRYEFILGTPKDNNYACSSISYNDSYVLSFTKRVSDCSLEQSVAKKLSALGLEITAETNY